jgi:hypothetical protein
MPEQLHLFDGLSTREGFNKSLKHFKFVMDVISEFEGNRNLAEILSDRLVEKSIEPTQILPTLSAILVDKYGYCYRSHNLTENFEDFDAISAETGKWKAMDLVVVYFHPELGVVAVNPKNRSHWDGVQSLKKNELVTVFAGAFKATGDEPIYANGIEALISMIEGGKAKTPAAFSKGKFVQRKQAPKQVEAPAARAARPRGRPRREYPTAASPAFPAAAAAAPASSAVAAAAPAPAAVEAVQSSTASKKMTPMYGIPVTNELFHNGNVEAWKKIIQSYTTKYTGLEVYVFYEGERIHDINTLFKWGKVKHGSSIMITVAGDDIKDVAKLQRYLKQGASHMFEAFLKAPVNTVLNLF